MWRHALRSTRVFASRRQFGVACPGGAETLIHYRILSREHASAVGERLVGEWDNDFRNCFGSIFWPAIDAAVKTHIPGALPWTRWCHSRPVKVVLPGGGLYFTERGAERGDPLGPAYAAAAVDALGTATGTFAKWFQKYPAK